MDSTKDRTVKGSIPPELDSLLNAEATARNLTRDQLHRIILIRAARQQLRQQKHTIASEAIKNKKDA